ncbi:MFS transporter [Paenibacillus sp. KQZ6P-2]|uniref:MFS transporter n=1 Tax=Paenibacillus mangrovi TaxID=2931978 RepID=A0A9X1WRU3_9BACL|nr:MFS transporter [Paenibacillus mangrovi]MCJ8014197.1 MFS transporter [Paenibacillus mangrovi]
MHAMLNGLRRTLAVRRAESAVRKGLRVSLMEGIPANILANLLGGPLQTIYLTYLGFTAFQIGIVLAIPPIALLIQIVVAIAMQKRQNRRYYMTLLGVSHRVLWVGTGMIPLIFKQDAWVPVYIVVWLLSFLSAQACGVIFASIMADFVPPKIRGKYFGIRNMVHWAVVCITLLLGGQIMEWLPGAQGFAVLFGISALCIIWNGWHLAHYPNPPFQTSMNGSSFRMLLRPFSDRRFIAATLFISCFILVQNVVIPLFSYVMLEIMNLGTSTVTLIVMLQNLVMMVSYYYWGILNSKYATNTLLLWTFPLISISCAMWLGMSVLSLLPVLILVHIFLGFALAGYNLLAFNFLIGDSPKSERPMYISVFSAFTGIAGFIGPMLGGWLYNEAEDAPLWLQQYGMTTIAGILMLLMSLVVAPFIFRR